MGILDMFNSLRATHDGVSRSLSAAADTWLLGLLARATFAVTLLVYFLNSALTKFDGGPFSIADAAYFQIVPPVVEAAGYDASQVSFIPWGLIVYAGSYAEVILPLMIVLGLLTRLAALGMISFVLVQSYVDIAFHGVDASTVGAWFDNVSGSAILDQRAFWVFLFLCLILKGAGAISLDALLARRFGRDA
jgi:putative oxidoreductase